MERNKHIRARLVFALTSIVGGTGLVASQAEAASSPVRAAVVVAPMHGSYQNGCTLSPDSAIFPGTPPAYYNFHNACDWHDLCYHYKYYGNSSSGRLACDNGFLSRMRSWCASYYGSWWEAPFRNTCYSAAATYYSAVRAFGGRFF